MNFTGILLGSVGPGVHIPTNKKSLATNTNITPVTMRMVVYCLVVKEAIDSRFFGFEFYR